jgi:hypothetical protein
MIASAEPDADLQRYIGIIREHLYQDYPGMFKPAKRPQISVHRSGQQPV